MIANIDKGYVCLRKIGLSFNILHYLGTVNLQQVPEAQTTGQMLPSGVNIVYFTFPVKILKHRTPSYFISY